MGAPAEVLLTYHHRNLDESIEKYFYMTFLFLNAFEIRNVF